MPNGYDGPERRTEAQEWSRWRGDTEARVRTLEREMSALTKAVADGAISQAETTVALNNLNNTIGELRTDIEDAAASIQKGKDDAVTELKRGVEARHFGWREWGIAVVVAVVGPLIVGLLLIVVGGGHP